ncbi:Tat pathway signal protein [Alloalcanivorax mobilis]|uniref:Tat pathway signal protein n=1 Tax=Alloalcanivorax mobilis TaxID=2019569 RepID=UPI000C782BB2|nr:Tat pathway signal protein [Alloalcanivorax mobilis]
MDQGIDRRGADRRGIGRRGFLKLGFWGSAALASGAALTPLLTGCSRSDTPAAGFAHLRDNDVSLLRPLVKPVLGGGLAAVPGATADDALHAFDRLLEGGYAGTRDQLFQLMDLLQLGAARWWLTGTWAAFADQSDTELAATLAQWQSKEGFAQLAFKGLTQPLGMAWYVTPEAALSTGYPGPPRTGNV